MPTIDDPQRIADDLRTAIADVARAVPGRYLADPPSDQDQKSTNIAYLAAADYDSATTFGLIQQTTIQMRGKNPEDSRDLFWSNYSALYSAQDQILAQTEQYFKAPNVGNWNKRELQAAGAVIKVNLAAARLINAARTTEAATELFDIFDKSGALKDPYSPIGARAIVAGSNDNGPAPKLAARNSQLNRRSYYVAGKIAEPTIRTHFRTKEGREARELLEDPFYRSIDDLFGEGGIFPELFGDLAKMLEFIQENQDLAIAVAGLGIAGLVAIYLKL